MQYLFQPVIDGWASWSKVYQNLSVFRPLAEEIFRREGLAFSEPSHCTPGTHAVFRVGAFLLKIYAPPSAGMSAGDAQRELWGLKAACGLGVPVTRPVASGCLADRYPFRYLITAYVDAPSFQAVRDNMTAAEKYELAKRLRQITDKLHMRVSAPYPVDILKTAAENRRWHAFPENFRRELPQYWSRLDLGPLYLVHGDLNPDNLLLCPEGPLLLDFGDSLAAPLCYEEAVVAAELFRFQPDFMRGYFCGQTAGQVAELCFQGLLLHDFGANILCDRFGGSAAFQSLADLKKLLYQRVSKAME